MLLIKFLIAKFRQSRRYMQQEVSRLSIAKDDNNTSEHASSLDYPKHKIKILKRADAKNIFQLYPVLNRELSHACRSLITMFVVEDKYIGGYFYFNLIKEIFAINEIDISKPSPSFINLILSELNSGDKIDIFPSGFPPSIFQLESEKINLKFISDFSDKLAEKIKQNYLDYLAKQYVQDL